MKNNLVDDFIKKAEGNSKTAFIYKKGRRSIKVSFDEFLNDVFLMNEFLHKNTSGQNILIFSYPYSYLFFVSIFSCCFLGKNIVIIDSFGDRKKTKAMMAQAELSDILTDNFTALLGLLLPGKIKKLNVKNFKDKRKHPGLAEQDFSVSGKNNPSILENPFTTGKNLTKPQTASITTFTSGTTGIPKKITRDLSFLENQIDLILNNAKFSEDDLVYGLLPVYTLLAVFMNHTCLVSPRIDDCNRFNVTMLLVPIKKVQKIKKPLHTVERAFLGGAILYKNETDDILKKLPVSKITYVYGASEGAVIYKTELHRYKKNLFTFDEKSSGINVEIQNPDKNGTGEIVISGKTVIGENNRHNTGDYGRLENGKLIILGRKKYSRGEISFYNYEYDELLRKNNPALKAAFSFYLNGKIHVAYTGRLKKESGIIYHHFSRLPYDQKHQTKLDYAKVIKNLSASSHPGF
ncbi:MAG: AMP-binding protein [Treponema sp.]|uniref:AMP-binding protein n=1 Tax=Treponema sp. TaxID=166 RepID=UPI00298D8236|nr:AMP-binding protein [Treponema sp.]MCR5386853.1 AMP-binding protein [Treponema sp.]